MPAARRREGVAEQVRRAGGEALPAAKRHHRSQAPRRTWSAAPWMRSARWMCWSTTPAAWWRGGRSRRWTTNSSTPVIDLNVRQLVHACKAGAAAMKPKGRGSIINVSSISARTGGSPGSSVYSGAKAFVSTFTRALARELAPQNIRVNALSPGTIATAFHERHSTPEKLEATRKIDPAGAPWPRRGLRRKRAVPAPPTHCRATSPDR